MHDDVDSRDHRRLGRELGLFATYPDIGAGLPVWLPRGAAVRAALERYIVEVERRAGYAHVYTPQLAKRALYERSGHWAHYAGDMFPPMDLGARRRPSDEEARGVWEGRRLDRGGAQRRPSDEEQLVLRPMNCPHHALVYGAQTRSWRDLPLRIAELGTMYRSERSGVLGGLSRVRVMTLNDAHIFCAADQVEAEVAGVMRMIERAYAAIGLTDYRYRLSLRGPRSPGKYVDDPAMWLRAESSLRAALDALGLAYDEAPGEAAFYGPKLDVQVRDHRGREETMSTVQLDFMLAERFGLAYADSNGEMQRPVIIHRGVLGTFERMVAHLIEVHAGAFPLWLAPVQVVVLPVTAVHLSEASRLVERLVDTGLRAELDASDRSLGARIAQGQREYVPVMAVIGDREIADGSAALRLRDGRRASLPTEAFLDLLRDAETSQAEGLRLPDLR